MGPPLDVCTNLRACNTTNLTTTWTSSAAGLFETTLWLGAGRLTAGKYAFKLHIPLTPNGNHTLPVYHESGSIQIHLDVRGRICAKRSSIVFCSASGTGLAGACKGTLSSSYLQDERLIVRLANLEDIDSLPMKTLAAVDSDTSVDLKFYIPGSKPITILMQPGSTNPLYFDAILPVLDHAGTHNMTINHGDMPDCLFHQTLVASCKTGYSVAQQTFKCIEAEEKIAILVCLCCTPLT